MPGAGASRDGGVRRTTRDGRGAAMGDERESSQPMLTDLKTMASRVAGEAIAHSDEIRTLLERLRRLGYQVELHMGVGVAYRSPDWALAAELVRSPRTCPVCSI